MAYANNRILNGIVHALLPLGIEVNAVGGPTTRTATAESSGGINDRKGQLLFPRREFVISFGPEYVAEVQALFYNVNGAQGTFMAFDPTDGIAVAEPMVAVGGNAQLRKAFTVVDFLTGANITVMRDIILPDPTITFTGGGTLGDDGLIVGGGDGTWSGTYYTPVQFLDERLDMTMHAIGQLVDDPNVFSIQHVRLREVLPLPPT